MKLFSNSIDQICKMILRPQRQQYLMSDLGPLGQMYYQRQDHILTNKKKLKLQCSFYIPDDTQVTCCVIYLHSINGSRLEASMHTEDILKQKYMYATFDFSGSGKSEGEYVTYGYNEIHDLDEVITFLSSQYSVEHFILWGRSMGSVVALKFMQQKFHNVSKVKALIVDSPFPSLINVIEHMAQQKSQLPGIIISAAISLASSEVKKLAQFDLDKIEIMTRIQQVKLPAFFITSKKDSVVPPQRTEEIYKKYMGEKTIHYLRGEHNSPRQSFLVDEIFKWINNFIPKKNSLSKKIIKHHIFEEYKLPTSLTPTCQRTTIGGQIKNKITCVSKPHQTIDLFDRPNKEKLNQSYFNPKDSQKYMFEGVSDGGDQINYQSNKQSSYHSPHISKKIDIVPIKQLDLNRQRKHSPNRQRNLSSTQGINQFEQSPIQRIRNVADYKYQHLVESQRLLYENSKDGENNKGKEQDFNHCKASFDFKFERKETNQNNKTRKFDFKNRVKDSQQPSFIQRVEKPKHFQPVPFEQVPQKSEFHPFYKNIF